MEPMPGHQLKNFVGFAGPILPLASLIALNSGCSVYMASTQPGERDMSVLKEGASRSQVIAALGAPIWSGEKGGDKIDVFRFTQGYSKGAKVARALFHGVADVFTLGLWEVLGTPIEAIASGTETKVEVTYDKDERVKTFQVTEVGGEKPPQSQSTDVGPDRPLP